MSRNAIIGLGIVVIIIVIASVLLTTGEQAEPPANVGGAATTSESAFAPNLITAAHQYNDNGIHIIAGEAEVPTPCHLLSHNVSIAEFIPERVTINFSSNVDDPDQVCAQVISTQRFKITFEASKDADISAMYNNQDVELNLQEVGPDENLEEFEVYTKG
jgi:hypothetical protein